MGLHSDEIDYELLGHEQMVEVELDPGETVIAEAGGMTWMESDIAFETRMGDGTESGLFGKLFGAGKRMLTGESLFLTHFTNQGQQKRRVGFSAAYPGTVLPIDLSSIGGTLICQKDAFLCAAQGTKLGIAFNKRLGAGFFGGEGFILEKLEGDGMVFVHAGGALVKKELKGETLRIDTGCLVAITQGIDYDIALAGGLKTMLFGGEGVFLATLSGHGTVWVQSLPFSRMADRVLAAAPSQGGQQQGES
ncbi:MAG: TIGR00266 family protein [Mariprofundaceae bacterium]|nr:TIGR00266 family protein [Mariprofundaceae bacterium]